MLDFRLKARDLIGFCITVVIFYSILKLTNVNAQSAAEAPSMPSSGSCALLVTLPVPHGAATLADTGYNFMGRISFTSASSGKFNGSGTNPTYHTSDSPFLAAGSTRYFNDWDVVITPMTSANGFVGGYKLVFSGLFEGQQTSFEFNGVPANGGKTIMIQSATEGTAQNPSFGPGSGVCQV
jgi:hypothetical protein